ncbi:MAG: YggS family pyridoxal phosphate-dependent enzyme, partial [Candidatus Margulisiibacteriota bacterium]
MPNVTENIEIVRKRIKAAAERVGLNAENIKLVAVTKTSTIDQIKEALDCGISDLGENRIQAAISKIDPLSAYPGIRWHMIGHLQTNKVKKAIELFSLIHGVDSLRLAREINKEAAQKNIVFPVLLEINVAGEA